MRDMTEDLVGLVPPPEDPEPAGGGLPESVVLPEDYLHFLSVYGVGPSTCSCTSWPPSTTTST